MAKLRLAFMGTPDFAVPALEALIAAGHEIACVYAQPPRPAGRGQRLRPSAVEHAARSHGLEIRTPASLRPQAERGAFRALELDCAVVAAYGLILPKAILEAPAHGCLNIHASLLPRWRGAAPIERAILAGDERTGVTIMKIEPGLDTGPVLLAEAIPIGPRMTAGELHDALAALGARLILRALDEVASGQAAFTPQPDQGACYAEKIDRAETRIDWHRPAGEIDRRIRALSPRPGAHASYAGARIKILRASLADGRSGPPGTVLDGGPTVACGEGALRIERLQREGRAALDAKDFVRGFPIPPASRFD